jgi:hypothetical protein
LLHCTVGFLLAEVLYGLHSLLWGFYSTIIHEEPK